MSQYQNIVFSAYYRYNISKKIPGLFKLKKYVEISKTDFLNRQEKEIHSKDELLKFKSKVSSQIRLRPNRNLNKNKIAGKRFEIWKKPDIKIGYVFFSNFLLKPHKRRIGVGYLLNASVFFIALLSKDYRQIEFHIVADSGLDIHLLLDKYEKGDLDAEMMKLKEISKNLN